MDVRAEVVSQFQQIAEEHSKRLSPLTDDLALYDSGLDSLCFAILVVRLELAFDVDPFASHEGDGFPVTFGEFVDFYKHATK
jgi:acyl carrier protein